MSVSLNTLQAWRIRDLVEPKQAVSSRIGKSAAPLTGVTLAGERRTLVFVDTQPTVIYFFSPACRWCEENWANVRALSAVSANRFRFMAVAAESDLGQFAQARKLDFEILGGISRESLKALGLSATPHMLVVSSRGQISHEWLGAFRGRQARSIEDFFEITLPGLSRPAETW
ncbi:MAG TPA: hypothetical protein VN700_01640 [Vicinamibacterales bacterium]|nr:hypothetical protein [Vicinamibacterales bacterium]